MKRILLSAFMAFFVLGLATAQTVYFSEDFEAGVPTGWTAEDIWMHGDGAANSSAYFDMTGNTTSFMAYNDDAAGQTHVGSGRVISTPINLTAVTGDLYLEVEYFFVNGDYQGADETFKLLASTDDGTTWTELQDFSALTWDYALLQVNDLAGSMVTLAFEYDDGAAWNFGAGFDNISFSDVPVNSTRRDYTLTVNGGSQFTQSGMNVDYQIQGVVLNNGYEAINSFDVTVTSPNGENITTFDGLSIEKGDAYRYEMPEMINTGESASNHTVTISNVNGEVDADEFTTDNRGIIVFVPQQTHPEKAVVVEEATGTWCTWCPRGTVYLDEMSKRFGKNFVGIAVHNGDPMTLTEYDNAVTSFPDFTGFPSVIYNRTSVLNPDAIVTPSISDMQSAPVASIELGASESGTTLSTSAKVRFMEDVTAANYNVSVVLTEDGLQSTANGWNQTAGAYAGGANGAMGGFEYFPSSVPSAWWPYSHVGRALIGGFNGVNFMGDFTTGMEKSVLMDDFEMNTDWDTDKMHIIAILTDAQGQVVNAKSGKYNDVIANGLTSTTEIVDETIAFVSPNPASDITTVNINLEASSEVSLLVMDLTGNVISNTNLGTLSGRNQHTYDVSALASGMYLFKVTAGERTTTKKVMVSK